MHTIRYFELEKNYDLINLAVNLKAVSKLKRVYGMN